MIYPEFLKQGNLIDVPAPSDGAYNDKYIVRHKNAKIKLENKGYKINLSKNIFNSKRARSADEKIRARELNEMFEDDSKALICAAGGEFLVEILPYVDFRKIVIPNGLLDFQIQQEYYFQ